jgi:outer membrane protein OmpA-like peptidoglycan-associated protein
MIMRITSSLIIAATLFTMQAGAQEAERSRLGVVGNFGSGIHTAAFQQLGDIDNCCPEFTSASGSGLFLGLQYINPLSADLSLHVRAHYGMFGAAFDQTESQEVLLSGGTLGAALIRHTLDADFTQISVEPLLAYTVAPGLKALGGITAGFVANSTFTQVETLEEPSSATFTSGSRQRNRYEGDIPDASPFAVGLTVGATYDLPLNASRTMFLSPEVLFTFSPLSVASGISWNAHQLRAGLAFSFIPPEVEDELTDGELLAFARTIEPPKRGDVGVPFAAEIDAAALRDDGTTAALESVRIEEFASYRVRPILPYVFFGSGQYDIPVRYPSLGSAQAENFSMGNFYNLNAIQTYLHVLNIVGKRLQDDPAASITLMGCADPSDGANAEAIARARATTVRDYLEQTWGISSGRMQLESRLLPEQASKSDDADGRDENRRVEISSTSPAILAPVTSADTMRVFTPSGIRFNPSIDPKVPIASWTIFVTQNDRIIKTLSGNDPIPGNADWRMDEQARYIPRDARSVDYLLVVRDSMDQVIPSATKPITISQITLADKVRNGGTDKSIDRYSMILFGFDRADLSPANQELVKTIKDRITSSSTARVIGYTDRSGAEEYNQRLSERRSQAVSTALGLPASSASGQGEQLPLYDNATPEGRFYSRTVEVIVETPRR